MSCLSKKAPVLLSSGTVKLIVLDSVAAPFRSDYSSSEMIKRAQHINNVGAMLCKYSHQYHIPVVCINQVGVTRTVLLFSSCCVVNLVLLITVLFSF